MRHLIIGDIHGGYKALEQVLDDANFDPAEDYLISVGDYCDGWPDTNKVIEFLSNLDNFTGVIGNHDIWFRDWCKDILHPTDFPLWYRQGGQATLESYGITDDLSEKDKVPEHHKEFLCDLLPYYEFRNNVVVHGGFHTSFPVHKQSERDLAWNRSLWYEAKATQRVFGRYTRIYIGHTSIGQGPPVKCGNVVNLDTGGGWEGVLTLMCADTGNYWQSDKVRRLYPKATGRV